MTKTNQDFGLYAGDSALLTITVSGKDITGATISWRLAEQNDPTKMELEKTVGSGITITDGPNGVFQVALDPDDTSGYVSDGLRKHKYYARVTDAASDKATVTVGTVTFYATAG